MSKKFNVADARFQSKNIPFEKDDAGKEHQAKYGSPKEIPLKFLTIAKFHRRLPAENKPATDEQYHCRGEADFLAQVRTLLAPQDETRNKQGAKQKDL